MLTSRLRPYGTTIFSEMTRLANEHGAINLAQGFPDFEGPVAVIEAAERALRAGRNQYARSQGTLELCEAVANQRARLHGLTYDPSREVVVFSGATEGIAATLLGLVEPGDEVLLVEPFYDSYPVMSELAGATVRHYTLRAPEFRIEKERFEAALTDRTKFILLNTPHNPTGRAFDRDELQVVADACMTRGLVAITDEVYEHLTYDGKPHLALAALPGMRERTVSLSSAGKTLSFTGWKIGWATGPAELIQAVQSAHQFVTFATATPLQHAVAWALNELPGGFYDELRATYARRRDFLTGVLRGAGLDPIVPDGSYFVLAGFSRVFDGDDRAFALHLTKEVGVAAIPPTPFFKTAEGLAEGRKLARFAFCKKDETLEKAAERLRKLRAKG